MWGTLWRHKLFDFDEFVQMHEVSLYSSWHLFFGEMDLHKLMLISCWLYLIATDFFFQFSYIREAAKFHRVLCSFEQV